MPAARAIVRVLQRVALADFSWVVLAMMRFTISALIVSGCPGLSCSRKTEPA